MDSGVTHPLMGNNNTESDHRTVYASVRMPRVASYQVKQYSYTRITDQGLQKFGEWLKSRDWHEVKDATSTTDKVGALHTLFADGVAQCFEERTRKRKPTEPVWMTDEIRDLIRKRRRLFKRVKRKGNWILLKKIVERKVTERKKGHAELVREKLVEQKSVKNFHKSISTIMRGNEQEAWTIRHLFPDMEDHQIAETAAAFFNHISSSSPPLHADQIPDADPDCDLELTVAEVDARLRKCKKPTSTVPGDLPPIIYGHFSGLLALVVTDIYNAVLKTHEWPKQWSREYVTVIPKGNNPEGIDGCRNISCTNYLSKVLENFVLAWLRTKVSTSERQYG